MIDIDRVRGVAQMVLKIMATDKKSFKGHRKYVRADQKMIINLCDEVDRLNKEMINPNIKMVVSYENLDKATGEKTSTEEA